MVTQTANARNDTDDPSPDSKLLVLDEEIMDFNLGFDDAIMAFDNNTRRKHAFDVEDTIDNYRIIKKLGEGGFGVVFMVESIEKSKVYILKAIRLDNDTALWSALQEMTILQHIKKHIPNCKKSDIACLKDSFIYYDEIVNINFQIIISNVFWDKRAQNNDVATSLYTFLHKESNYTLFDALDIYEKIVSAVIKLHDMGIVHLDLKPDNLLIDSLLNIHVIDFGVSCMNTLDLKGNCRRAGTKEYQDPSMQDEYNTDNDIYSMAVVLQDCIEKFVKASPEYKSKDKRIKTYRDYINYNKSIDYACSVFSYIYNNDITAYIRDANSNQILNRGYTYKPTFLTKIIVVSMFIKINKPSAKELSKIVLELITAHHLETNPSPNTLQGFFKSFLTTTPP
jgi:serine/threonine protein kinase